MDILVATTLPRGGFWIFRSDARSLTPIYPMTVKDDVHLIGRTGRAGASGHSISLACEDND
ncbi:hypothetical protein ACNKHL_23080 [Shigella flexneri]